MDRYEAGLEEAGERVTLFGEFESAELEAAYRLRHAGFDRLLARVIIVVAGIAAVGLGGIDLTLFPDGGTEFVVLTAARWSLFALSAAALVLLRGSPTPTRFTAVMVAWNACTAILPVVVGVIWPPGHIELRMTASLAIMMTYCVMPLTVRFQMLAALQQTAAHLLVIAWLNPLPDPQAVAAEAGWLAILNVLGVVLAHRLHARHRRLYAALQRQSELSANLGRALAEVRTLRGLIRVCAWCRKVDAGADWQQLEAYIRANSDAEFTHGICPPCLSQATSGYDSADFMTCTGPATPDGEERSRQPRATPAPTDGSR